MFKVRSNIYPRMRQQLKLLIGGRETKNKILRWKGFLNKTQQTFWYPHYLVHPKTHYRLFCLHNSDVKSHFLTTPAQALTAYYFKLTCVNSGWSASSRHSCAGALTVTHKKNWGIVQACTEPKANTSFQHNAWVWGQLFIFQASRGEHWCNYS